MVSSSKFPRTRKAKSSCCISLPVASAPRTIRKAAAQFMTTCRRDTRRSNTSDDSTCRAAAFCCSPTMANCFTASRTRALKYRAATTCGQRARSVNRQPNAWSMESISATPKIRTHKKKSHSRLTFISKTDLQNSCSSKARTAKSAA